MLLELENKMYTIHNYHSTLKRCHPARNREVNSYIKSKTKKIHFSETFIDLSKIPLPNTHTHTKPLNI